MDLGWWQTLFQYQYEFIWEDKTDQVKMVKKLLHVKNYESV